MQIGYTDFERMHGPLQEKFQKAYEDTFASQWFVQGKHVTAFEEHFAEYCGAKHCIGVGNGLDALRLLLMAYDIGTGDEVIVPSNTFIATVLAISYVGATPVFVEPIFESCLIDTDRIEEKITEKTKAIMVVHLYGRLVDMEAVNQIARKHKLYVFEDTAQAHGVSRNETKAGNFADGGAFSFYPGKNLGAFGDGGAVIVNDDEKAAKIRALGNYGSSKKYQHDYIGMNSRLDELQAAFLDVKLPVLEQWNRERKQIAKQYYEGIDNGKIILPDYMEENVYHIFPVFCQDRDDLQKYLEEKGIKTLIHYPIPIHLQGAYAPMGYQKGDFPIAEQISEQELSIPLYPGMTEKEVEYVVSMLNGF